MLEITKKSGACLKVRRGRDGGGSLREDEEEDEEGVGGGRCVKRGREWGCL